MGLNDEEQFHPFAMDCVGMDKGKSIGAKEKQANSPQGFWDREFIYPSFSLNMNKEEYSTVVFVKYSSIAM